jgi:hypothetical protein
MVLVLEFTDLHILHMLNISNFLLQLLDLVEELSGFEVTGGSFVDGQTLKFVLPYLNLIFLLVDQLSEAFILSQELVIVLHN